MPETSPDTSPMIRLSVDGPIARLTLDRPERHNALDHDAIAALIGHLDRLAGDEDLRALVLTGTGRSFCSGIALGELDDRDWTETPLTRLCNTLEAFPRPTICALNGGVYGGGVELALSCDFRIGVTGMKMFIPPARIGIHYDPAGMARALNLLGLATTRRLFLMADTLTDAELERTGFVDELIAPELLEERVAARAATLSGLAPLAVSGMKRTLSELTAGTLDAPAAAARIKACFASEDHAEGLRAMREKRPPAFRGR